MGCTGSKDGDAVGRELLQAAEMGNISAMEKAIKDGAYVDWSEPGKNYTPLMAACWNRREDAALELIKKGSRVNIANTEYGSTALHIAAFHGLKSVVEALLACEADFDMTDKNGKTPVDNARTRKHMEIVKILSEKKTTMYGFDEAASRDLFQACKRGVIPDVQRAVDRGADLNWSEGGNCYTSLMIACWTSKEEAALCLIGKNADVNIQNMQYGSTALHLACQRSLERASRALLEEGAKTGVTDKAGKTPIDYAKNTGNIVMIDLLEGRATSKSSRMNPENPSDLPSHWATKSPWDFPKDHKWLAVLIRKDSAEFKVLENLMNTDTSGLGKGRDVLEKGTYSSLKMACAWRIENLNLWRRYSMEIDIVRDEIKQMTKAVPLPQLKLRQELFDAVTCLPSAMMNDVNEAMMLHGLKPETCLTILQNGPNMRFSSGNFGQGTYLAEDIGKSDQYVTKDTGDDPTLEQLHTRLYREIPHPGNVYYTLVCRVIMGFYCRTNSGYPDANDLDFSSPVFATAERTELATVPAVMPPQHYHSLLVETGAAVKRYREFVQFHEARLYPEYLIAYHRMP